MIHDAIFWVETGKINPNPYQPRKEFDEVKLKELADSIRQYGVLQPLVVTRKEIERDDGGLATEYELIAGERRLRASKIAGIMQVPVIIREGTEEENNKMKLELALIENIQREDLSAVDRARAFKQLADEFKFKHFQIAERIGKSREYVSNTIRLLSLPDEMIQGLAERKINEGHTRPLLMLVDRPEEQMTLFKEIIYKQLNVRDSERIARHIATERVRQHAYLDPEIAVMERRLSESFGTRVHIEKKENGGKITIDFFGDDDFAMLLKKLEQQREEEKQNMEPQEEVSARHEEAPRDEGAPEEGAEPHTDPLHEEGPSQAESAHTEGERGETHATQSDEGETVSVENSQEGQNEKAQEEKDDEDLYSVRNFTI